MAERWSADRSPRFGRMTATMRPRVVTVRTGLVVRAASPSEFDAVADLTVVGFADGRSVPPTTQRLALLRDTAGRATGGLLLVAELDGTLAGTATLLRHKSSYARQARRGEAELRLLAVLPAARGGGIGAALLGASAEIAESWGEEGLVLDTGPQNPSRRLYERLGFQRQLDREILPASSGGNLVVYRKALTRERT